MVEAIGSLFDSPWEERKEWDADQWKAYCSVILITLENYVKEGLRNHSFIFYRVLNNIESVVSDLYKLDGIKEYTWDNVLKKLSVVIDFIQDTVEILDKNVPKSIRLKPSCGLVLDDKKLRKDLRI